MGREPLSSGLERGQQVQERVRSDEPVEVVHPAGAVPASSRAVTCAATRAGTALSPRPEAAAHVLSELARTLDGADPETGS